MSYCKVTVGKHHPEPCGDRASYRVEIRRSEYDDAKIIPACGEHAVDALDSGARVTGPFGYPCRLDGDGEIHEAQP